MAVDVRATYLGSSVETASPSRLLVMLMDRLVLDVQRAHSTLGRGDRRGAHPHLVHAQDIIEELRSSLKPGSWEGATVLLSLYDYLHTRLVTANVQGDVTITEECLGLVTRLAETWRDAAVHLAVEGQTAAKVSA